MRSSPSAIPRLLAAAILLPLAGSAGAAEDPGRAFRLAQAGPTGAQPYPPQDPGMGGGYPQPQPYPPQNPGMGGGYPQPQPYPPQNPGMGGGYPQPQPYPPQNPGTGGGYPQPQPYPPQNPGMGGGYPQPQPYPPQNPGMGDNGPQPYPPPRNGPGYDPRAPQPAEPASLPPGIDVERLKAVSAAEKEDFGVPQTAELHPGAPHAPTPTSIPGGRVIDTLNLVALLTHQPPVPVVVVDALGGQSRLPGALPAAWASQAGSMGDQVEGGVRNLIQNATGGDTTRPVVVYCSDPHCWMSYNAALRIIALGYRNVLWYRGGISSWQQAGLPVQPQGQGQ